MLGRALKGMAGTLLAGVVAFLPLMLTALLLGWLGETAHDYIGPGSQVGEWLRRLGLSVVTTEAFAYLAGIALLLAAFWVTGLLVKASLLDWLFGLLEGLMKSKFFPAQLDKVLSLLPTTTFKTTPCCASVFITILAAQPINPPITIQIMKFMSSLQLNLRGTARLAVLIKA